MNKLITFLLATCLLLSCKSQTETDQQATQQVFGISGYAQGTTYSIKYVADIEDENLYSEVDSILQRFDLSLSTYKENSIISLINRNEQTETDELFRAMFQCAMEVSQQTNGAFDITVAPLVNAYGFGFTNKDDIDNELIDSLLQYVGYEKIVLKNNNIEKQMPEIMVDANAIAQGLSVDVVAEFLKKKGYNNFLVEIGGEVFAQGNKPNNETWKVGVDKPIDGSTAENREIQAVFNLKNIALATSGNYRKYYEENGEKFSHTINPKTGKPVSHSLLSATVFAKDCMRADAYATAFMVMGLEETKKFLTQHTEFEVYLIYATENNNFDVYMTEGAKNLLFNEL